MRILFALLLVVGCGSITTSELSADGGDAAAGRGGAGGSSNAAGASGSAGSGPSAGANGADAGGRGGSSNGGAGDLAGHAGSDVGGRGGVSAGGAGGAGAETGAAGHPAAPACPTPISPWGTRCPPYPDGTYCVLGCIYNNAGNTYEPPTGSCYAAATWEDQGKALCVSRSVPSCAYCP